jgi:hypothetical protein
MANPTGPDDGKSKKRNAHLRSRPVPKIAKESSPTTEQKLETVLENFEYLRDFYQSETSRYSHWFIGLQVVTLVGAALTPLLLLVDLPKESAVPIKLIQALPSAIAGVAAAINASLRFRQDWAQNYVTLSDLVNEAQKFTVRASPDYDQGEDKAIDAFQNRMSEITMAEVKSWQTAFLSEEKGKDKK